MTMRIDARFERAAIAVFPVAVKGERHWPETQHSLRMTLEEAKQKRQQRIAPGQSSIQIEKRHPGLSCRTARVAGH